MKQNLLLAIMVLLLSSCSGVSLFQPTQTPTPTATPTVTPTKTPTPFPTSTPTPDFLATYLPYLPDIPPGFEWQPAPDLKVILLMPDGWYFSREKCPIINFFDFTYIPRDEIGQVCISRESLEDVEKYSTGQAVLVYKNIEDPQTFATDILRYLLTSDGGEMFIYNADQDMNEQGFMSDMLNIHKTTKVIKAWDYTTDKYTVHHLRVEAEYPYETEANRYKIVQYSTGVTKDAVFLMIFETPIDSWDEILADFGLLLDYMVVLDIR